MNLPPPPPLPTALDQPLSARRGPRVQGWLLVVVGLGLSVTMAVVAITLYQTIAFPGLTGGHSRWHGGPGFTRTMFELFGAIFILGLCCIGGGAFPACTGRRPRLFLIPMLLLGAVIAYLALGIIAGEPSH